MQKPFERILLATEHTEFDSGAERVAIEMARRCGLPLMAIIPIVSNPEFESAAPELASRAEQEAASKIAALQNLAQHAGVRLDVTVRRGEEPAQEIVEEAIRRQADLLITRRRGKRSFLANLLVGEMVGKVAAQAPCSVLMVPRASHMWSKGVLLALDYRHPSETLTELAATIAGICSIPLTIASVTEAKGEETAADAVLQQHVARANAAGTTTSAAQLSGKVSREIVQAASARGADLIVVAHGHRPEFRKALGHVAREIIGLAETAVLVAKTPMPHE
ncbi:MAG: universal stress protein [Pseudomonadota bacterium]